MSNWFNQLKGCEKDLERMRMLCRTKADAFMATGNDVMASFLDDLGNDLARTEEMINEALESKLDGDFKQIDHSVGNFFTELAKGRKE